MWSVRTADGLVGGVRGDGPEPRSSTSTQAIGYSDGALTDLSVPPLPEGLMDPFGR